MTFAIVEFPCVRMRFRNNTKETFGFDALMKECSVRIDSLYTREHQCMRKNETMKAKSHHTEGTSAWSQNEKMKVM